MSNVPTLQEEVTRKALEALESVVADRELGKITEAQYSYALTALWASCAGIAGDDFFMLMELAKSPTKGKSFFTKSYFLSGKGQTVRITNTHTGVVCCDVNLGLSQSRKVYDLRDEPNPYIAAKEKFQSLCDNLVAKGFLQI